MSGKTVAVPGSALARMAGKQLVTGAKLPKEFHEVIAFEKWARSVAFGEPYDEPNPDFISRYLAVLAITAGSEREAWSMTQVNGLQKILPDSPAATTGPLEITDLYVAKSDFETGNGSFLVISAISLASGEEIKTTTGATNVQATMIGLLENGVWPIKCQFKRGDSKDKGGRYLIHMLPPD